MPVTETVSDRTVVTLLPAAGQAAKEDLSDVIPTQPASEQNRSVDNPADMTSDGIAGHQPEPPRQPDPPPLDSQPPFRLAAVQIGQQDGRGQKITHIYIAQGTEYAIYQAGEVMVQFSDDPTKVSAQRKSLLAVSSARAEVNFLLEGLDCREIGDRQLAYGLQLALDGNADGAAKTIAAAKATVLLKRASRGRFQYLKWSFAEAAVLIGLLFVANCFYPFPDPSVNLWLAAKAGVVGAVFSIALAIRGRTVALDTDLLDNVTDGSLRLVIGVISAGVLLLLFTCGMVPSLKIGDADFRAAVLTWQMVLVIGFLGGFLERLVPDLLERRGAQGGGGTVASTAGVSNG